MCLCPRADRIYSRSGDQWIIKDASGYVVNSIVIPSAPVGVAGMRVNVLGDVASRWINPCFSGPRFESELRNWNFDSDETAVWADGSPDEQE